MANVLLCIGAGAAAGTSAVFLAPAILGAAGFTAGGVAAGSVAAGAQAMIGNVAAGSLFAALQSAGAAGFGYGTIAGIISTVGTTVGTACAIIEVAEVAETAAAVELELIEWNNFPLALKEDEFNAGGVACASVEAMAQALIGGNVEARSVFAALQSAGAAGFGWALIGGIFSGAGTVASYLASYFY